MEEEGLCVSAASGEKVGMGWVLGGFENYQNVKLNCSNGKGVREQGIGGEGFSAEPEMRKTMNFR